MRLVEVVIEHLLEEARQEGLKVALVHGLENGFQKSIETAFDNGLFRNFPQEVEKGIKEGLFKNLYRGLKEEVEKSRFKEGLEEGKLMQSIPAIRTMLKKGFPENEIAEILTIKPDLVKTIKNQLKKEPRILLALKSAKPDIADIAKKLKVSPLLVQVIQESLKH